MEVEIEWWEVQGGMGTAYVLDPQPEYDVVKELHQIIKEVTGKDFSQEKPKIGFY